MNNGKRVRKTGKFVQPTVEEINKDRKEYVDYKTNEAISEIYGLQANFLNLKVLEARIEFRLEQLGLSMDGTIIGKDNITEQFNGVKKPKDMLNAELNVDVYNYKMSVADIERQKKYLKEQLKFTEEQIKDVLTNKFDIINWKDERIKELNKEVKAAQNYVG